MENEKELMITKIDPNLTPEEANQVIADSLADVVNSGSYDDIPVTNMGSRGMKSEYVNAKEPDMTPEQLEEFYQRVLKLNAAISTDARTREVIEPALLELNSIRNDFFNYSWQSRKQGAFVERVLDVVSIKIDQAIQQFAFNL